MPAQFWSLTVHEFWVKHDAFHREEDRRLWREGWHVLKTTKFKNPQPKTPDQLAGRLLRTYPEKPWMR